MIELNIEKEHRYKVELDLSNLIENLNSLSSWNKEIEAIEEKMSAYKNGGFGLLGGSNITVTIDDILARDETKLNNLKSNVDYTNYKLKEYTACLEILNDRERELISGKYLTIKNKYDSYEKIGKIMNCSHTTAKRWHDSAIEKIAVHKFRYVGIA
jgi:hypothetical protein